MQITVKKIDLFEKKTENEIDIKQYLIYKTYCFYDCS